jgi:UDP-N-acetyl-D-mannosaminuronate dehydrogenase
MFAMHGVDVVGVDINEEVVDVHNNGDIHSQHRRR